MSALSDTDGVRRHPWLESFAAAPEEGFADLIAGHASIHPYDRADAPDAARMLFGPLAEDDPLRRALDGAVMAWLEKRRRGSVPTEGGRRQRFIREVGEAFEIIAILRLHGTALTLRRRFALWNDWVDRLVLSNARDARAEYWRTLALTQPLLDSVRQDDGVPLVDLEPFWLRLCREAGSRWPRHYLDIGLLGLRRLPTRQGETDVRWLAGLAHWARANDVGEAAFKAEWLPLKSLYPRTPTRWRKLVGELLRSPSFAAIDPPGWWRCDPDFAPMLRPGHAPIQGLCSPMPEDCDRVIEGLRPHLSQSRSAIEQLMNGHRRYAQATGDPRYLVRAIHALGRAMIGQGGPEHDAYCAHAEALVREGLSWEPDNRYLWSLWRETFEARGALEAAELVAWEFVRRDPGNPNARNQLAGLLAELPDREGEAEAVLRETIEHFPDNAVARTQLAELLIAGHRLDEAREVVDAAIAADTIDVVTWAIAARLRSYEGDNTKALEAVRCGQEIDPQDAILAEFGRRIRRGEALEVVSQSYRRRSGMADEGNIVRLPEGVARRGRLRRLRFALEHGGGDELKAEVGRHLEEWAGSRYVEMLALRHGLVEPSAEMTDFATAFEAALANDDRTALETLAERFPRLEALTWVARAVLGDDETAAKVRGWLESGGAEEQVVETVRRSIRPFLHVIEGGASPSSAFVDARGRIEVSLHDANEAGLEDYQAVA